MFVMQYLPQKNDRFWAWPWSIKDGAEGGVIHLFNHSSIARGHAQIQSISCGKDQT